MTTGPKKGFYWYIAFILSILLIPVSFVSLIAVKQQIIDGTFWEHWKEMLTSLFLISIHAMFIYDVFKYKAGYTMVRTTEYKLFKCRESGEEKSFMMFADNEDELELFFEITHPSKKFFIEVAEMTGKSIEMKVFNGDN